MENVINELINCIRLCFRKEFIQYYFKGNAQFVKNTIFGLREKMIAQLRKNFGKIPMNARATISVMLLC